MKKYTYYFNDGTKSTVEVSEELYKKLKDLDDEEESNNRRNTRRHSSIECLEENGIKFADKSSDICEQNNKKDIADKVDNIISSLTPSQYKLFEAVYYGKGKVIDIAEKQGVVQSAISNRLNRIRKKFEKFFILYLVAI